MKFYQRHKELLRELAQTQARLRLVQSTIARELGAEFDTPQYQRGYRDALRTISRSVLLHQPPVRQIARARQSNTTVRVGSTATNAHDPESAS